MLEVDELTEIFTKYADMKRAAASGSIAVSSFGPETQKILAVFDASGDGLIEPSELQRAAELYADSKQMVSRLIKLSVVLLLLMGALLGCIAGLTIAVSLCYLWPYPLRPPPLRPPPWLLHELTLNPRNPIP